ncbi:MAG: DUF2288 domain-containing protein [Pseudomonadota bacterium]|nr:DUF2288 domain-containing protein [Pseudomonadota bacterium]
MDPLSHEELIAYLNAETGKITWQELQPYFAKGSVVYLAPGYDLVDVAAAMVRDDKKIVMPLLEDDLLGKLSDERAQTFAPDSAFWAVVVAPWVIVQPQQEAAAETSAEEASSEGE